MDAIQRQGNTMAVSSHIEDSLSVIDQVLRQIRDMSLDRHVNAQSVSVRLARSIGYLLLTIEDDGEGFEVGDLRKYPTANATLGVRGMEERAEAVGGRIEIKSANGKATKIRARFPILRPKV